MSFLLTFLGSPFGRKAAAALAIALAFLALLAEVRHSGSAANEAKHVKAEAQAKLQTAKTNTETQALATSAGSDAKASQALIVYRTKTIVERIPNEIPAASDVRLSPSWVRDYNVSLGLVPDDAKPAGGPEDGTGVLSADALKTAVTNDGSCLVWKDHAERLVKLWDQTAANVNGKR